MAIGMAMGIAAGLFLQSKQGKALTKDAQKKALELQKQVMKRLGSVHDLTKERYADVVEDVLAYYAKGKHIAKEEAPAVRAYLLGRWATISKHLKDIAKEVK